MFSWLLTCYYMVSIFFFYLSSNTYFIILKRFTQTNEKNFHCPLTDYDYCGIMYLPWSRFFFYALFFKRTIGQVVTGGGPPKSRSTRWYERMSEMRVKITLACSECKQRNYDTMKNKKNTPDRIEMSKYCRFCKKHTMHKETK